MPTAKIGAFPVDTGSPGEILRTALEAENNISVNCLNVHSFELSFVNTSFFSALDDTNILLPDGAGIAIALSLDANKKITKVSGFDFFHRSMTLINESGGSVFFLGGSSCTLDRLLEHARMEFPKVQVAGLSPEFKDEFTDDDVSLFLSHIESHAPSIVFVGVGAPKQEILIAQLKQKLLECGPVIYCGIGAVFDFYAGEVARPNQFLINHNLEWFGRLLSDPRRIWRRIVFSQTRFCIRLAASILLNRPI